MPILKNNTFSEYIKKKYQISTGNIMRGDIEEAFEVETTNGAE